MIDWPFEIKKFALKLANDFIIIYTILKALKVWRKYATSLILNTFYFILDCTFVVAQTF